MKKVSIIALTNSKNSLLLQLRDNKPNIAYPDTWGFIGGSIEEGETEIEAMRREILEEINLEINKIHKIGYFQVEELNLINNVFAGKIEINVEDITLNEGQRVQFFDFEELAKLKMPDKLREFILKNKEKIFVTKP